MGSIERPGVLHSVSSLREGVGLLAEGMRFLAQHRGLWGLALVPVFFALILVTAGVSFFWYELDVLHGLVEGLFPAFEVAAWWNWLWVGPARVLFWLLGWLLMLIALAFVLIACLLGANLLSAPFLDRLSERVEEKVGGAGRAAADRSASVWSQALRSFGAELQRLLFLSGIGIGLSLAGFLLPGAHLVTGPLLILLTIHFLPLDYAGFALDRRGASFRERRSWLRAHRPLMWGFGSIAFVACLVPGLNLLLMPALVTAGTLLVNRREPASLRAPVADAESS